MRKLYLAIALALATMVVTAGAAFGYTLDPATGTGFVGKGEVQTAFGWNNNQLQQRADTVSFEVEKVTENSWVCSRIGPQGQEQTQERENVRTTAALVDSVARERNQVTGFILEGYDPDVEERLISREGPPLGSCPTGWTAGPISSEVISSELYAITTFGAGQRVLIP
jgi:hypothetical protein